jgi:cation transport ATPase
MAIWVFTSAPKQITLNWVYKKCRHGPKLGAQLMQQPQPRNSVSAETRNLSLGRTVAKLESELRRNQRRIEQLHQRNAQISQKVAEIAHQPYRQPRQQQAVIPSATRTPASRQRQSQRSQKSRTWLSIVIIFLCIIVICGTIGFALTRLIAVR